MEIDGLVKSVTGASTLWREERVQSLWSGYGEIVRYRLEGAADGMGSVIVKHVSPPEGRGHPRGWDTNRSHQRKLRSYEVEMAFYQRHAGRCGSGCRVAKLLGAQRTDAGWMMVLEDLNAAGFPGRVETEIGEQWLRSCLSWLGSFHATFLGEQKPGGLWEIGTYWHLATRPDEWAAMGDGPLKEVAGEIDARLSGARFQTLVHGDAKVANFCFSGSDGGLGEVAAVDFQYVGGGCGMKDLVYFLGSCLPEGVCERREAELLGLYFEALGREMLRLGKSQDPALVEAEWRKLYPMAWADFHRFLVGWSPGHWKLNGYSERLVSGVMESLQ